MAKILDVTDATFEASVLKSDVPVLVDFWAEWCAPCRQLAPTVKELAEEYGEKLRVVKVDVDANPGTAAKMQVRAMPTLLVIKGGAVVGATDSDGVEVIEKPFNERNLFATIFTALGIDPYAEYTLPGLPTFHRVEEKTKPILEVLA